MLNLLTFWYSLALLQQVERAKASLARAEKRANDTFLAYSVGTASAEDCDAAFATRRYARRHLAWCQAGCPRDY